MMCQRIGLLPTRTIGLGLNSVSSLSRAPRPPHRITVFMVRGPRTGPRGRRDGSRAPEPEWKSASVRPLVEPPADVLRQRQGRREAGRLDPDQVHEAGAARLETDHEVDLPGRMPGLRPDPRVGPAQMIDPEPRQ